MRAYLTDFHPTISGTNVLNITVWELINAQVRDLEWKSYSLHCSTLMYSSWKDSSTLAGLFLVPAVLLSWCSWTSWSNPSKCSNEVRENEHPFLVDTRRWSISATKTISVLCLGLKLPCVKLRILVRVKWAQKWSLAGCLTIYTRKQKPRCVRGVTDAKWLTCALRCLCPCGQCQAHFGVSISWVLLPMGWPYAAHAAVDRGVKLHGCLLRCGGSAARQCHSWFLLGTVFRTMLIARRLGSEC